MEHVPDFDYEKATSIPEIISMKDLHTRGVYFRTVDDKLAAIDKAVAAGVIKAEDKTEREHQLKAELAKNMVWYTKQAIAHRIETEFPIALRDTVGIPYKHSVTGRPLLAIEVLDEMITDPQHRLSMAMQDALEKILGLPEDYLDKFTHPQESEEEYNIEQPMVEQIELGELVEAPSAPEAEVAEVAEVEFPAVPVNITNKTFYSIVIRMNRSANGEIDIELLEDKRAEGENVAHLMKSNYRYENDFDHDAELAHETVRFVV